MPQPLKSISYSGHLYAVLERPACAVLIAAIVAEWVYVENMLTMMLTIASGSFTPSDENGIYELSMNYTAQVVMDEVDSIRTRLNIVEKALIPRLPDELREGWKKLRLELQRRAKDRNKVAHANWVVSDDHPADLILVDDNGSHIRYTEKDFKDILERINAAYGHTRLFTRKVIDAHLQGEVQKQWGHPPI